MKVIEAFWEKRNLGVNAVEFELDGSETTEEIRSTILSAEKEYNTVKVPAGNLETNYLLTELGYSYVESLVQLIHDLKEIPMTKIAERLNQSVSYEPMKDEDLEQLFAEIKKGMFQTDRISLDSHFSVETANRRYVNWLKDESEKGSKIYKLLLKEKAIGFFSYKEVAENVGYPFLAGVYEDYSRSGLGVCCIIKTIEETKKRGMTYNRTFVSTNNQNALATHFACGFRIEKIYNVFVKHQKINKI